MQRSCNPCSVGHVRHSTQCAPRSARFLTKPAAAGPRHRVQEGPGRSGLWRLLKPHQPAARCLSRLSRHKPKLEATHHRDSLAYTRKTLPPDRPMVSPKGPCCCDYNRLVLAPRKSVESFGRVLFETFRTRVRSTGDPKFAEKRREGPLRFHSAKIGGIADT